MVFAGVSGVKWVLSVFFKVLKDFSSLLKISHIFSKIFKGKKIKKIFVIVFIIPLPG